MTGAAVEALSASARGPSGLLIGGASYCPTYIEEVTMLETSKLAIAGAIIIVGLVFTVVYAYTNRYTYTASTCGYDMCVLRHNSWGKRGYTSCLLYRPPGMVSRRAKDWGVYHCDEHLLHEGVTWKSIDDLRKRSGR